MDQTTRNKLRSVVTQCRRLLEEAVAQVLQGQFGVYAAAKSDEVQVEPATKMTHLSAEDQDYRRDILDHFEHVKALGYKPTDSLAQLVREVAFTHLNRLCAYKMMEARGLIRESVSKGLKSQGFLFYLADHDEDQKRHAAGQQDVAYRHFLNWLGGTLSDEIGVLFSPTDPANRLYPPQRVLDEVLGLLNSEELAGIWTQDEAIGWVYQYFTPKELRDQARKESQAPRNSYELAFRNQFFTPRYVVEFLTDNTLGRIWYEMRQGKTRLADRCRYLVRQPDEVFLARATSPGEEHPQNSVVEGARLLREGDEESFPLFDTSEGSVQRMIDMAHTVSAYDRHGDEAFKIWNGKDGPKHAERTGELSTQYLLDWLFMTCRADRHGGIGEVYTESWFLTLANEVRRRALAARNPDLKPEERLRLLAFVPYRAKKDPRELKILDPAVGSAHFLLYCFDLLLVIYEEAYADPELGPALQREYPALADLKKAVPGLILKHNLHGIDIDLRATQIAVLALWLRCQRAYQDMGLKKGRPRITKSNIVCAERMPGEQKMLKEFVAQLEPKLLGQLVEVVFEKMKLAGEAGSLLKVEEEIRDAVTEAKRQFGIGGLKVQGTLFDTGSGQPRPKLFDVKNLPDDQFFEQAEAKVVEAMRKYAEQAQNGQLLQRRLFTEDAVQGFAFVEMCHKRFDVVLMNPPFGDPSKPSKTLIEQHYPRTKNDLYAAFVEQGIHRLRPNGKLGAITSRTGFYLSSFQKWREELLLVDTDPSVFVDLGQGVLDAAMVETAAYCLSKGRAGGATLFVRLLHAEDKECGLLTALEAVAAGRPAPEVFSVPSAAFAVVPGSPFAYWVSSRIRRLFRDLPAFDDEEAGRATRCGLGTTDNFRFLRLNWEVPVSERCTNWLPYYDGGVYSPVYDLFPLVVWWRDNGKEIKDFIASKFGSASRKVQGEEFYKRPGFVFPRRTKGLCPKVMAPGGIFSNAGQAGFVPQSQLLAAIGFLTSEICSLLISLSQGRTGDAAQFEVGLIKRLPWVSLDDGDIASRLASLTTEIFVAKRQSFRGNEVSHTFVAPFALLSQGDSLRDRIVDAQARLSNLSVGVERRLNEINAVVLEAYHIEPEDRLALSVFSDQTTATDDGNRDQEQEDSAAPTAPDRFVEEILSYAVGCIIGRWDIRFTTGCQEPESPPDPLAPLPITSPGTLRCTQTDPGSGTPKDYPLRIDWDGIIVDDPDHPDDIVRWVRNVLEVCWNDHASSIEKEACDILGVKDMRDYFRKPGKGGFWDDHVARYSKSRRSAPIYWLLQSSKKNYALWLYYLRLDKEMLFKALQQYVEPKIRLEENRLEALRTQNSTAGDSGKSAKKLGKDMERQEDLLSELRDFEDKLRRAADLHLEPDLNDGVVLNIAPLHELVPWKEAKVYWQELIKGEYEWSSIGKQLRERGLVK